ncbi:MAG: radical SAM protein [Candidatus Eremiobacteraeota bacterium]|nr:radical SAM protein [Candidatus Eremiobacteraeota bacterium]
MERIRRLGPIECVEIEAKSVLNRVRGMPFEWSINPYRGCYHQCVFCFARRTHAFLEEDGVSGWGRVYVKVNAPEVLRRELARPGWRRSPIALGTATDAYQPVEGSYRITRRILAELVRAKAPTGIVTRSPLICRDADVLEDLARRADLRITISLPTLDADLARKLEPTVAPPGKRLFTVQTLAARGLPVGISVAPIVPHLTDSRENFAALVRAARDCGATFIWSNVLYLREAARDSFFLFLREHYPEYVAEYERLYARIHLPKPMRASLERRFDRELRSVELPRRRTFEAAARDDDEQLALFPGEGLFAASRSENA